MLLFYASNTPSISENHPLRHKVHYARRFRCKILTLFSISSTSCINLQSQLLFFAISNHSCNSLSATGGPCSPWPVNVARHLRKCAWYGIIAGFDRLNTRHDDNGRVTTNTTEKKNIINHVYSENNLEEKNLNSFKYLKKKAWRSVSKQGRRIIYNNLE